MLLQMEHSIAGYHSLNSYVNAKNECSSLDRALKKNQGQVPSHGVRVGKAHIKPQKVRQSISAYFDLGCYLGSSVVDFRRPVVELQPILKSPKNLGQYRIQGLTGGALALGSSPEDNYNNKQKRLQYIHGSRRDLTHCKKKASKLFVFELYCFIC